MPLFSVILPVYNRAELLKRAVGSVLAQKFCDYELIIVDDGSSDDPKSGLGALPSHVTFIRQENRGVSAARNLGIAESRGQILAFLDSDDEWLPQKLLRQSEVFKLQPDIPVCHTEEIWVRNGVRVNQCAHHQKAGGDIFAMSLKLCAMSPSSIAIRREVFAVTGLFDENLPACEDFDLWIGITARYPVHFVSEPLIIKYGGHEDQLSRTVVALDRYRIQSLSKHLNNPDFPKQRKEALAKELLRRIDIYISGCIKRGRHSEVASLRELQKQADCLQLSLGN